MYSLISFVFSKKISYSLSTLAKPEPKFSKKLPKCYQFAVFDRLLQMQLCLVGGRARGVAVLWFKKNISSTLCRNAWQLLRLVLTTALSLRPISVLAAAGVPLAPIGASSSSAFASRIGSQLPLRFRNLQKLPRSRIRIMGNL